MRSPSGGRHHQDEDRRHREVQDAARRGGVVQAEPLQREVQPAAGEAERGEDLASRAATVRGSFRRMPAEANGSRIASTIARRPTVAMPGAMSSRTARATIQLPDQSRSVAISTNQAVKRIGADYPLRANLDRMPHVRAAGRSLAYEWIGQDERQAGAGVPARRARLDPAVARFPGEARRRDRLPRAGVRPLRLRAVGRAGRAPAHGEVHARRSARGLA